MIAAPGGSLPMTEPIPTLDDIRATAAAIAPHVLTTPITPLLSADVERLLGRGASVHMKLELFQYTGTFKARGTMANALNVSRSGTVAGLTAASAGNHAVATAWAARRIGVPAKVVMVKTANPLRVALAELEGATVILADDAVAAFAEVERIKSVEGFAAIHPFDGHATACGTGTLGAEVMAGRPDLDAVIVSIGGGGLAGGLAHAIKLIKPSCLVLGVEPKGADAMSRSIAAGQPVKLDRVDTIADSLAPPMALPYGFTLCRSALDDIVTLDDDQICAGLALLQRDAKLAVEPAAGAVAAALFGPYRRRLAGKRVGLIVCGANIDAATYARHLERGARHLEALSAP
jgi:threonine dehydratase